MLVCITVSSAAILGATGTDGSQAKRVQDIVRSLTAASVEDTKAKYYPDILRYSSRDDSG